jgi:hypothetical protein
MTTHAEKHPSAPVGLWWLLFGAFGGSLAWAVHLLLSYPLVPHICATGWEWALHLITLVTALVALAATWVAWRAWQQLRKNDQAMARRPGRRSRFMAFFGILHSGFFFLVTVFEGLPVFFLNPCFGVA